MPCRFWIRPTPPLSRGIPSTESLRGQSCLRRAKPGAFGISSARVKTHIVSPSKTIRNIVKTTGIEFSAHDLRRTFATLLSEDGAYVITIENAHNHSPSSIAARSYVNNPRIKDLRKTYQSLEDSILIEVGEKSALRDKVEISLED